MSQTFPFQHFLKVSSEPEDISSQRPLAHREEQLELREIQEPLLDLNNNKLDINTNSRETNILQSESAPLAHDNKNELVTLNNEILNYLKSTISSEKFNAFFENLETKNLTSTQIEFSTPTPFIKTMITEYFSSYLDEAIQHNLGKSYKVVINTQKHVASKKDAPTFFINEEKTRPEKKMATKTAKLSSQPMQTNTSFQKSFHLDLIPTKEDLLSKVESKYINHMQPDQHGILIDPNKTFENFIIGPSNNIACATAKAVSSNPGKSGKYPSLYFYSDSGLGKTHLLHSVANAIKNQHPRLRICLITARDFMNEMINAIQNNNIANFRKKYSEKIDVLMIDDIHELKDKQGTQNEFFHIFNELHDKGKQLIFTSDKAPKEIAGIEERIKTRLQWGLVIDIQKPDLETKIAILKRKAYELDLYCTEDVIILIASSIKSSIRELEGALVKLSAFSDVMKMEIDTDIVKEQLNLKGADKKTTDLEDIAKAVSQYFKIPLADLKSKARSKEITKVRHIAMYLSRKIVKSTQQEVGYFYGGRDHTSVIHAVNKISQQSKKEPYLANTLLEIQNLL